MILNKFGETNDILSRQLLFNATAAGANTLIQNGDIASALVLLSKLNDLRQFGKSLIYDTIRLNIQRHCICNELINNSIVIYPTDNNYDVAGISSDGTLLICTEPYKEHEGEEIVHYIEYRCYKNGEFIGYLDIDDFDYRSDAEFYFDPIRKVYAIVKKEDRELIWDKSIELFDIESEDKIFSCCLSNMYRDLCFSSDGKWVIYGSYGGVRLLGIVSGDDRAFKLLVDKYSDEDQTVSAVCSSPDGKTIVARTVKNLKLWDIMTEQCLRTFEESAEPVYSVCFSPDGKTAERYKDK